jgi:FkbM family methyltransferase
MTPLLQIRSFSNDQYILDKIFYANSYRVRAFKDTETKPLIVDVGAHAGYFSFAATALGAGKVYAVEPFTENYDILIKNTSDVRLPQVIRCPMAIFPVQTYLNLSFPKVNKGNYFDFSNVFPAITKSSTDAIVPAVSLDFYLSNYVSEEQIDLLKIHLGYAEVDILKGAESLTKRVKNICGQVELDLEGQLKFKQILNSKGYIEVNFIPVDGEDGKVIFQASQTKLTEMFIK